MEPNPKSPPFEQRTPTSQIEQDPAHKSNIYQLKLVGGRSSDSERLHHMRDGCVVLYKRSQSTVWQVRFKLFDLKWHHYTTKHKDLEYARRVASTLYDRARFAEEMGLPLQTKTFGAVAQACLKQLDMEIEQGIKARTCLDYQRVIRKYLIPFFGRYNITSIDIATVRKFELWRNEQMGSVPKASTLMTHASAYSRVIDLAVERGWLSANTPVPRLSRRGKKSVARPGFTAEEVQRLLAFMPDWAESDAHRHTGRQIKLLLRDYVEVLLATGMRAGRESMNLLWQHIEWHQAGEQRYLRIWVSGKTGGRWLIAKHRAALALERLATVDQIKLDATNSVVSCVENFVARWSTAFDQIQSNGTSHSIKDSRAKLILLPLRAPTQQARQQQQKLRQQQIWTKSRAAKPKPIKFKIPTRRRRRARLPVR